MSIRDALEQFDPRPTAKFALSKASSFVASAGLVVDEVSGTRVAGHIELTDEHFTPWGVVHGGVYTTAVESAASIGASEAVKDRGEFAVGVHNGTDFLRASKGGRVDVVAEPLQQGRVQQLWLVTITASDSGKVIARGQVRLQNVPLPT
ncbi:MULTISPECIES: PaaI family thioesterase [unclassified Rhodococcus (in: high G+C Gram-positive bacteria)]|uniref:PaaI family thioesterase n=1 Tax=unclassified Rhodococcus (in: high G+C Gram-positive bacteria) TaxID=192944 RepID=UPI0020CCBFC1|nr:MULTISPECIES: PaaI family thioesterase [unclassified Rhodococcus (in: high G+C Gram-positive bacteria)]